MCDPVSIGLGTAGASALGVIAKDQEGLNKARSANQAAVNRYNYQNQLQDFDWQARTAVYRQKLLEYDDKTRSYREAAYAGYRREQERLNETYNAARFTTQGQIAELLQKQGALNASGIAQGTSTRRAAANVVAQYGMNQAILAQNLLGAHNRFNRSMEDITRQWKSAQNAARSQVAIAPMFGPRAPAPTQVQGPSSLSLMAGLAGSAMAGVKAGFGAAAPGTQTDGGSGLDYENVTPATDIFDSSATGLGTFDFSNNTGIDFGQGFNVSDLEWTD